MAVGGGFSSAGTIKGLAQRMDEAEALIRDMNDERQEIKKTARQLAWNAIKLAFGAMLAGSGLTVLLNQAWNCLTGKRP
jgi:hypothetical protein